MKNSRFAVFVVVLLASVVAAAQQASKPKAQTGPTSRRVVSIAGRASDDGTIVLRNSDGKVWEIDNPAALKGHEGLPVVIQGQLDPDTSNVVHVLSVKAGKSAIEYMTKWDDSAFRR